MKAPGFVVIEIDVRVKLLPVEIFVGASAEHFRIQDQIRNA